MAEVPLLVCLHGLGLDAGSFDAMTAELGGRAEVLAVDLPGFGGTPALPGTSVDAMADMVAARVRRHLAGRPQGWGRWLLVGHSMGGKVATVLAARTLRGEAPLFGLAGVVLLAGSPPGPEPMPDEKRAQLLGWAAGEAIGEGDARTFVDDNTGSRLPSSMEEAAVAQVMRSSSEAWQAWLLAGSREDRTGDVGRLDVPALMVSGDADEALGAAVQPRVNGPVYPRAQFQVLAGAGHLLMLERPAEVASAIEHFWSTAAGLGPSVPPASMATIASSRVTARTRAALAARALADDPAYAPQVLSPGQLAVLRALAGRVIPQDGPAVDVAARVDAQLAAGAGNGWRFADLPADADAYRAGLDALAELPRLPAEGQDALLAGVAAGEGPRGRLDPAQLARWFEDCCDDLTRLWLAHPASLARVGFDGYASGGDAQRLQGFVLLGAGQREAWEPVGPAWT